MPRMRRRTRVVPYRRWWFGIIKSNRPGFAGRGERLRRPVVAALAREGLSARLIGRVLDVSKSTILGIAWRSRRTRQHVRLVGNKPQFRARNELLRSLPRYPRRYH